jgi:hypothetical protein
MGKMVAGTQRPAALSRNLPMSSEVPANGYPLDEDQQQRILAAVLTGPVVELIREVVRRLPQPGKKSVDGLDEALATQRQVKPIEFEIPPVDESPRMRRLRWPGSGLTWDDRKRLATIGNTTRLRTNRVLHQAVRVAHHLFRTVMLEIMATSEQTGTSLRDLLTAVSGGNLNRDCAGTQQPQADPRPLPDRSQPVVAMPATREPPMIVGSEEPFANHPDSLAAEATADGSLSVSLPPHPMSKRTAAAAPREGITDDRIQELEERMQRLQETMDVLIGAIDELRVDLVHTLRNLPDRLPPPLHIHSLPLDPTDPDFGERVNAIPQEVMARLREEAVRARRGESALAAAAEGDPAPPTVVDETPANDHRRSAQQGRLFG